ncbi:hypothetical protein [Cellulosimicrobium sp. Marseille-Q4280]|uniref:hypothetical protein n=1 Tax=Cellulosimicrobium sp. Marseille-Q4280 TaxID=2937992 RepID=UPI00204233BC|nr:hypothetical protein [Cellulosimicrobium sp. Marseille-Q4280]
MTTSTTRGRGRPNRAVALLAVSAIGAVGLVAGAAPAFAAPVLVEPGVISLDPDCPTDVGDTSDGTCTWLRVSPSSYLTSAELTPAQLEATVVNLYQGETLVASGSPAAEFGIADLYFFGLRAGTYTVEVVSPDGFQQVGDFATGVVPGTTTRTEVTFAPSGGVLTSRSLQMRMAPADLELGQLGIDVWVDTNLNGIRDAGETGPSSSVSIDIRNQDSARDGMTPINAFNEYLYDYERTYHVATGTYDVEYDYFGSDGLVPLAGIDPQTGTGTVTVAPNGVLRIPLGQPGDVVTPPAPAAPVVSLSSGPGDQTQSTTAEFVFVVDSPEATLNWSLDGGPSTGTLGRTVSLADLSVGAHELRATAALDGLVSNEIVVNWEVLAEGTTPTPNPSPSPGEGEGTDPAPGQGTGEDGEVQRFDVAQGQALVVNGFGFDAGEQVEVRFLPEDVILDTVTAEADGTVRVQVSVPTDAEVGLHSLRLTGLTSGVTQYVDLNVSEAPAAPVDGEDPAATPGAGQDATEVQATNGRTELEMTGVDETTKYVGAAALAAVALGGGLVLARKRMNRNGEAAYQAQRLSMLIG